MAKIYIASQCAISMLAGFDQALVIACSETDKETVAEIIRDRISLSIVSNPDIAKRFSSELGVPISYNREEVCLGAGDSVIVGEFDVHSNIRWFTLTVEKIIDD